MATHAPGFFQGTEMPSAGWWSALWPDPAAVVATVGIAPGMTVIDLCCGDGWFTRPIARIARSVVAIDIDPDLLGQARAGLTGAELTRCAFVLGDACDVTTLAPGGADFIFLANAFHGVPDRPRLARAVHDTLRLGGRFAVVNWHRRPREQTTVMGEPRGPRDALRLTPEMTIAAVESGGLAYTRLIEIPPYHYATVFSRREE